MNDIQNVKCHRCGHTLNHGYYLCYLKAYPERPESKFCPVCFTLLTKLGQITASEWIDVVMYALDVDHIVHPAQPAGLQTPIEESYTAIPPLALSKVACVMASGTRKYGPRNWDSISVSDHLDHAIRHGYLYVMGDTEDEPTGIDHLAHMACRALMALEVEMLRTAEQQREGEPK